MLSESRSNGVTEKWSAASVNTPPHPHSNAPRTKAGKDGKKKRSAGFALYEVLIGLTIFVVGVLALGRAVENCLNASTLSAEEERVREILSNRMAEIQTAPGNPDVSKEFKIETGYGAVKLIQKTVAAGLTEPDKGQLGGIFLVTLTAQWGSTHSVVVHHVQRTDDVLAQWISESGGGKAQSKSIEFYVYRPG